ncbi:hypothetical protein [Microbacterium sp. GXF6406]
MSAYPDALAGALACLADNAVPELVHAAERAVQQGTHTWMPDPAVPGVWGLALPGGYVDAPRADVVVYCAEGDFTASDAFTMEAMR